MIAIKNSIFDKSYCCSIHNTLDIIPVAMTMAKQPGYSADISLSTQLVNRRMIFCFTNLINIATGRARWSSTAAGVAGVAGDAECRRGSSFKLSEIKRPVRSLRQSKDKRSLSRPSELLPLRHRKLLRWWRETPSCRQSEQGQGEQYLWDNIRAECG